MKLVPLVAAFLLAAIAGCTSNDPKTKMRQSTREFNDATSVLTTIKDAATFETAKPKLRKHFAWLRQQNRENQARTGNKQPGIKDSQIAMKEFETLSKEPEFKELTDALMRYAAELLRVTVAVPGFKQFQDEEMAKG